MNRFGFRLKRREDHCPSCAYCKGEIAAKEPVTTCRRCRAVHHKDCAWLLERCRILGCDTPFEAPVVAPTVSAARYDAPMAYSNGGCIGTFFGGLAEFFFYVLVDGALELVFSLLTGLI